MEKSGKLLISSTELAELQAGKLPSRLAIEWGLTLDEALRMVREGCYEISG